MLEQRATRHQALLDFGSCELYVEIVGESLNDFIQPEIGRLERRKLGGRLDLLVEPLEFLMRIHVLHAQSPIVPEIISGSCSVYSHPPSFDRELRFSPPGAAFVRTRRGQRPA